MSSNDSTDAQDDTMKYMVQVPITVRTVWNDKVIDQLIDELQLAGYGPLESGVLWYVRSGKRLTVYIVHDGPPDELKQKVLGVIENFAAGQFGIVVRSSAARVDPRPA